jgi:hypothetical protein
MRRTKANAICDSDVTALHCAALGGYCEVADLLIASGCPVDARPKERNAIVPCSKLDNDSTRLTIYCVMRLRSLDNMNTSGPLLISQA